MKTNLLASFVLFAFVSFVSAIENTNNSMTSGTFGVAWLNNDGYVQVFDGQKIVPLPVIKTYAVGAADLLAEGSDQLVLVDNAPKGLNIYSFKTNTKIGPFGSNVNTFAVGRFARNETFPSFFACTFDGDTFRWTKEIMDKGWIPLSGMFSQVATGNVDSRNNLNEFVTVSEGNVYIYSPQWDTYGRGVEGKNITATLTGNVTASPGNEIVMLDKSDNVWLYQNGDAEDLKQKASCLTFGKNGDGLDTLYALDAQRKPVAYNRESKTWKNIITQDAFACSSLITQTNPDGKGHTLYVVRDGNLYRVNAEGAAEQLSEQKLTKVILKSGDKPVAEYRFVGVPSKPYIEKLRTPSGHNVLRDAPHDHLHHHALMFAIAINGCNFWEESSQEHGNQLTASIKPQDGLETAALESQLDWNGKDARTLVKEDRKISVSSDDKVTLLDWQTTLKTGNEGVILDKSNHHYFGLGIRFDESMDKEGRFFDHTGKNDGEIFRGTERLTPCRWMAYTAKLDGKPVTVAVLGNPKNSIPTMAFTMGGRDNTFAYLGITLNLHREPVEMKPNSSLTFNYRVAVWDGEAAPETVEKVYQEYVK